jgi:flagellar assembly protein FliH
MSSRLIRGEDVAIEPPGWRQASMPEAVSDEVETLESDQARAVEIEERVAAAYQRGFEEGRTAGRESLAREVESVQKKLARSIEELSGLRSRYRREAEQDAVALALAVARRILHRELTMAPEALLGLVKAALDKMEAREVHRARVARADANIVRQFVEQMGAPQRIEVVADAGLAPGSLLLESARGTLDASVDTQLDEIERGFADLVGGVA